MDNAPVTICYLCSTDLISNKADEGCGGTDRAVAKNKDTERKATCAKTGSGNSCTDLMPSQADEGHGAFAKYGQTDRTEQPSLCKN